MVSADDIVRFGCSIGLDEDSNILDLCCGYGTMLKIWCEMFGVSGIGVDRDEMFIDKGRSRLPNDRIKLICGDVLQHVDAIKYRVVVCTELSTGLFNSFQEGIIFLERFIEPGGIIVFGKLFSNIPNPPQELIDFDGPLPTLSEIYDEAKQCGYLITSMASGGNAAWERYVMGERKAERLTKYTTDPEWAAWTDKWHKIYYDYRRPYEGWALFGMEKL
jgi:SAM-dependent methyltransferase